jgi:hypothetical protein
MSIVLQIVRLQVKIETIAENHSVPGPRGLSLDDTLAGLDLVGRRRVMMLLEMVKTFSEDGDERNVAEHIQARADRAWHIRSTTQDGDVPRSRPSSDRS